MLIGDHFLLRDFGLYGTIFMNVCVYACYNRCHDSAVKGFGAKYLLSAIC
jgi:hypothetical protein